MDPFSGNARTASDPGTRHYIVLPSDTTDLAVLPRGLYCTVAGTAVIRDEGGVDVTYDLSKGDLLPFRAKRVLNTGTTATLVAWY